MPYKTSLCLLLILVTASVYSQVRDHEFVNYDDPEYVVDNPHVNTGMNPGNFSWAFTSVHAANWHPLTWLSHMVDVQLFGLDAGRHHLMNVLLHLANTLLLLFLLYQTTGSYWKSLIVAALFALHPLHVESVAWIAERKDVLSTLFWMLTIIFYVRYVTRPGRFTYLAALCAFGLGLLSKPMLVTLPLGLFLLDYWPLGRISFWKYGFQAERSLFLKAKRPRMRWLLAEKAPFVALSIASSIITLHAQWQGGSVAYLREVPIPFRVANALVAYVAYLGKLFWPRDLAVIYPLPPTLTVVQIAGAALVLVCITGISVAAAQRHPYLIVGWLWYLLTLVPVIGLVQVGQQFIADRYTYIPFIGLFVMMVWGLSAILSARSHGGIVLASMAGLTVSVCTILAWRQLGYWKNTITLFDHACDAIADNYVAHNILGDTLVKMGRIDEGIVHYSKALQVWPDDSQALIGMGVAFSRQGKMDQALHYYDEELRNHPESADGHYSKGLVLMKQGDLDTAIWHYREALRIEPNQVGAQMNLGTALIREGKTEEGFGYYYAALRNNPRNAEAHVTVGLALAMEGKLDDGMRYFEEAIQIKPDFADAHYNVGVALARQGKFDEAISRFREALRLEPGLEAAKAGLAAALRRKETPRGKKLP